MKMYKCPNCGKIYASMYCDVCEKSIPESCAVQAGGSSGSGGSTSGEAAVTNELLSRIVTSECNNNYYLGKIEKHTRIIAIIMAVSASLGLLGAVITLFNLM